jgi:hypothetical protein
VSALRKFAHEPWPRQRLVLRALVTVAFFRAALSALPFRWVRAVSARRVRRATRDLPGRVDDLSWAVAVASRRVPRASCLALQNLLAREGYRSDLHIGVAKSGDGGLEAHAWLESGGRVLIGGGQVERFTRLAALSSLE